MGKAVLIYPHDAIVYPRIDLKKVRVRQSPMGIAYVAAYARSCGHGVRMVDVRTYGGEWESALRRILAEERPDFAGLTCLTPFFSSCAAISRIVKQASPDTRVVWGGPHPSVLPRESLAECPEVDLVVRGEGEIAFTDLLDGKDPRAIPGVACRTGDGLHVPAGKAPAVRDLDSLPWPAYDLLPYAGYRFLMGGTALTMITGRGCPYTCNFCASEAVHAHGYRVRTVKDTVDEMEYYVRALGVRQFILEDDTFTVHAARAEAICAEIRRRRLGATWFCNSRVTGVSLELLRAMRRAGCRMIFFGIESGNQGILDAIGKQIRREDAERTLAHCREAGVRSYGLFILGHPHETPATAEETIAFAAALPLDYAQFSLLVPVPGSRVYEQAQRGEGIESSARRWDDYVFHGTPIIRTPALAAADLEGLRRMAYRRFFLRPGYVLRKLFHSGLRELVHDARAAWGILGMMRAARG